ncbi:MAG: biotin/lipoyl-binding protein, partial [Lachnospiraceae bacterium]|nr:biotin/lipoyl-binding protein [Lachnospiraceae bacterium]
MAQKKKLIGRILIIAALVVAVGAAVWVMTAPDEVEAAHAESSSYRDTAKEAGIVRRYDEHVITSEIAGEVTQTPVRRNDTVKKGQIIARVSPREYEISRNQVLSEIDSMNAQKEQVRAEAKQVRRELSGQVKEIEAQIAKLKTDTELDQLNGIKEITPGKYLDLMRAQYNVAGAEVVFAESEYGRAKKDKDEGIIDEYAFREIEQRYYDKQAAWAEAKEKAGAASDQAWDYTGTGENPQAKDLDRKYRQYTLESARQAIGVLETQVSSLKSRMGKEAETAAIASLDAQIAAKEEELSGIDHRIEACEIKAPCDGILAELPVKTLDRVSEGETLAVLKTGRENCLVECSVRTDLEYFLHEGDPVEVIWNTRQGEQIIEGTIAEIYDYAQESVSSLGLKEYRTTVMVSCEPGEEYKDGYQVTVRFTLHESDGAILVPVTALYREDGQYC